MVHSEEDYNKSVEASNILFGNATANSLRSLDEETFMSVFEGVPCFKISKDDLCQGIKVIDLLAEKTNIFPSKGETRKTIQGNGLSINKEKVADIETIIDNSYLLNDKYILIQKGKKNYFIISIE